MQPWEREILEYRPSLGFTPEILSVVISKPPGSAATFRPSALAMQSTQVLGSDIIDNIMATLSRANDMLKKLDKCKSTNPVYQAYRAAKDSGDLAEAERIHFANIQDIDGDPQIDAIPILENVQDEMEQFLDFLNRELFDGKADYSDMASVREDEEKLINSIFQQEATGKSVDYETLLSRIRLIIAGVERMTTYQTTVDMAEQYLLHGVKELVANDPSGLLYYLSSVKESDLPTMQQAIQLSFNSPAQQAVSTLINMGRAGDREFRDALDAKLSSVRKTFLEIYKPLLPYYLDDTISVGAGKLKSLLGQGVEAIASTFEQLTVDHMSNSVMNRLQMQGLFAYLTEKKNSQLLYRLIGTFTEEFDPVDLDKEVKRFIKHHGLDQSGTLCG